MQWWFGFIDGNEDRRARFERASISGRVWKVYDRMCIASGTTTSSREAAWWHATTSRPGRYKRSRG
jgi:hypothetical protein